MAALRNPHIIKIFDLEAINNEPWCTGMCNFMWGYIITWLPRSMERTDMLKTYKYVGYTRL